MALPVGTGYQGYILYLNISPAGFATGQVRAWPSIYGTKPGDVMQAPSDDGHANDFAFTVQTPTSLVVGQNVLFDIVAGTFANYAVNLR